MTPDQIAFIKAHWNVDMSGPDIADEMGIEYEKLRKSVTYLRRIGHEITMPKRMEIGTITTQRMGNRIVQLEKTATGMKWLKSETRSSFKINRHKPKTQPMPKRNNPRKIAADKPKPIKRTTLTDAEKLAAGYEWIWINSKTKVLRHPSKLTA